MFDIAKLYNKYRRNEFKFNLLASVIRFVPNRYFDDAIRRSYRYADIMRKSLYLLSSACEGRSEMYKNWLKEHKQI